MRSGRPDLAVAHLRAALEEVEDSEVHADLGRALWALGDQSGGILHLGAACSLCDNDGDMMPDDPTCSESGPSWLLATACGLSAPVETGAIGFADLFLHCRVNGNP